MIADHLGGGFFDSFDQAGIRIIHGDVRDELKAIPDEMFHTCVTSPPYWGMRDYGYEGQIGAERRSPTTLPT